MSSSPYDQLTESEAAITLSLQQWAPQHLPTFALLGAYYLELYDKPERSIHYTLLLDVKYVPTNPAPRCFQICGIGEVKQEDEAKSLGWTELESVKAKAERRARGLMGLPVVVHIRDRGVKWVCPVELDAKLLLGIGRPGTDINQACQGLVKVVNDGKSIFELAVPNGSAAGAAPGSNESSTESKSK
ncbi:hypothetical protein SAICODRAFT_7639 [Saitoella complicata NRRL Y-17804]|uniref:Uncharacterized protein n=1 Tax=Saitoella complicata (strain BCRC 22490 / CBS 7301 / JCM 7358 / NBRC 10748 / NRRL Y-17804) TaxID=698492 RepID=A0A0E9NGQ9_SAICN|nr:uncharacterized protein SAICODRAFT_7639 [Saitoella complicata NRRL Y-17804]ODQ53042.1 hypothetical protein SAICODRAFT_7639 [Saitoella complicata NRRL Y-17804]GAO48993.1 hypothetical protein G7K_3154-t1 [Saitoella complicata NRRL Y-17804]